MILRPRSLAARTALVLLASLALVQVAGLNILTDPVMSRRIGPTSWLGPKRVRPPAVPFELIPPIDVVLLSHDHYDPLDRPTLRQLAARDNPLVLNLLGVSPLSFIKDISPSLIEDLLQSLDALG